jgi:hypothetical protein
MAVFCHTISLFINDLPRIGRKLQSCREIYPVHRREGSAGMTGTSLVKIVETSRIQLISTRRDGVWDEDWSRREWWFDDFNANYRATSAICPEKIYGKSKYEWDVRGISEF